MGDAHPSLAPQWLKSGTSLNLRPQAQGGPNTGMLCELAPFIQDDSRDQQPKIIAFDVNQCLHMF